MDGERTLRIVCAEADPESPLWSAGLRAGAFKDRGGTMPCRRPALRFMGSRHGLVSAHGNYEPLRLAEARSGARVCDPQQGRFMESRHDFEIARTRPRSR
ncbi:MAG: hypothetical protein DME26_15500 [Verrucomicrobia bacterium]|nr:MAG: hypothetical protein DME26_15500 [Verrucomicrobiota bacterium]